MKIAIAGSSGMIGSILSERLQAAGHTLFLFSRGPRLDSTQADRPAARHFQLDLEKEVSSGYLEGIDVLINLAGTRIKGRRWSRPHKKAIYNSRINSTRNLVRAVINCKKPPSVFISASAAGFYGNRGDEILHEDSGNGSGFLADVTRDWEAEALNAVPSERTRVVLLRSAPVLSPRDGALKEIVKSFKLGFSSSLGAGTQWMPWIHIDDEVNLIIWAMENGNIEGALNAAAPDSKINSDFMKAIADQLGRLLVARVPAMTLRLAFGEMADEMLLASQRVMPEKALNAGFEFKYPTLEGALQDLLGGWK